MTTMSAPKAIKIYNLLAACTSLPRMLSKSNLIDEVHISFNNDRADKYTLHLRSWLKEEKYEFAELIPISTRCIDSIIAAIKQFSTRCIDSIIAAIKQFSTRCIDSIIAAIKQYQEELKALAVKLCPIVEAPEVKAPEVKDTKDIVEEPEVKDTSVKGTKDIDYKKIADYIFNKY